MTPILYWNFEDLAVSGFKDKIHDTVLHKYHNGYYQGTNDNLTYNSMIRSSGAVVNPIDKIYHSGYLVLPVYSGESQFLERSGAISFSFWLAGYEGLKEEYDDPYAGDMGALFSIAKGYDPGLGGGALLHNAQLEFELTGDGNASFRVARSGGGQNVVTKTGVDLGRWNFFYCEYKKYSPFDLFGISVNGGTISYGIAGNEYSTAGGHTYSVIGSGKYIQVYAKDLATAYQDAVHVDVATRNHWFLDELAFWDGNLTQEKVTEYYHNGHGYSYSGDMSHQWMYPRSDKDYAPFRNDVIYNQCTLIDQDPPNSGNVVPFGRRYEYVNEALDPLITRPTIPYAFPFPVSDVADVLYFSGAGIHEVKFGLGKMFVKPSSVLFNLDYAPDYQGFSTAKVWAAYFLDKNDKVIASGHLNIPAPIFPEFDDFSHISEILSMQDGPWDLSDSSLLISYLLSDNDYYPGMAKTNLLVSGIAIMETGISLYENGIPIGNDLDLYLSAYSTASSGRDLYIGGKDLSESGTPLYMFGAYAYQSGISLYTGGYAVGTSGLNLYTISIGNSSGDVPLFIEGIYRDSSNLPLFTKSIVSSGDNFAPLFTYGDSGVPAIFGGKPLYLFANENLTKTSDMPLYLMNSSIANTYTNMPLFLDSNTRTTGGLDLILQNTAEYSGRQLRLYIRGDGELDGASIKNGSMPLFMERTEGTERGLDIYMRTNSGGSSGVNMYMNSVYGAGSGLNAIIFAYDVPGSSIPIFTCGY